jgi:hypothetical protein
VRNSLMMPHARRHTSFASVFVPPWLTTPSKSLSIRRYSFWTYRQASRRPNVNKVKLQSVSAPAHRHCHWKPGGEAFPAAE